MSNFRKLSENSYVATVEHHPTIGSTNDRAIACAALPGLKLPLLVVADQQTAGRGRGLNRWWTGPGSLAFSLLLGPEQAGTAGPRRLPLISLAAGVAVVEALAPLVAGHEIGIHWPNDVMLDGRKLAGILIEALPDGKHVIGIGINTNNTAADAPEEVRPRVVTLRDATSIKHDPEELLLSILKELQKRLAELTVTPARIAARTNELCWQRGKRLKVTQGDKTIEGCCLGIAVDGALILEQAGKQQAVYSGVVTS
jgi:BirA family transcriptional regulator, biotin operon repressor / biotin---[acetyl-CoA-carboxylase] ligase